MTTMWLPLDSSQPSSFFFGPVSQMVNSQLEVEVLPVEGLDVSHVLPEDVDAFLPFFTSLRRLLVVVTISKVIERSVNMGSVSIDKLLHWIKCVDLVDPRTRVRMARHIQSLVLFKYRSHWCHRVKSLVSDDVFIVMRSKESVVALHLVFDWDRDVEGRINVEPHGVGAVPVSGGDDAPPLLTHDICPRTY